MRYETLEALQRLIDNRHPEGPTLEYKRELNLGANEARREALKDLTGMANGRGGTVIFGLDESIGDHPVPIELTPMTDLRVVGVLEDLVRDGVRPPLLLELAVVEQPDGGYLLVAEVQPSPLGPYMVEAYGTFRYFLRAGRSTAPMTEQQVRDAYAIAQRARDRRPQIWAEHALPLPPLSSESPFISASALPEEPLSEIIDLGQVDPDSLMPDGPLRRYLELTQLHTALWTLTRWAFGLLGSDSSGDRPPSAVVRVHVDGAVAFGTQTYAQVSPLTAARLVNAELLFMSWIWTRFDLRRPVEIRLRIDNLAACRLTTFPGVINYGDSERVVREPPGVPIHHLEIADVRLPSELTTAATRHGLVRRFVNRLHHGFGERESHLFRMGQLYGRHGGPAEMAIAGSGLWDNRGERRAVLHADDSIRHPESGEILAFAVGGAVLDPKGNTLAVLEFAESAAFPDDFILSALVSDSRARVLGGNSGVPEEAEAPAESPVATGRWAGKTLQELFG